MTEPKEREPDRADDDEPLSLAPSQDKQGPASFALPPDEQLPAASAPPPDQDEDEDAPILLIPVDEEPSREIPPLEPLPEEPPADLSLLPDEPPADHPLLPEEPPADLPPLFPTPVSPFVDPEPEPPPEAVERRVEDRDEEPGEPPSLYPLDLPSLTFWMFGNVNTMIWMGATAVLAILLFGGYLLSSVLGAPAQVVFWLIGFYLVAAYPFDILRAAVAGAPGLPDWSDYGGEGLGRLNAAGVLVMLLACLLPGLLVSTLLNRFVGLPFLLAGWTVFPAALLLFATSGSLLVVNPLAIRDALVASGWRYLLAAAPGYAVLIARVIFAGGIQDPFIEALLFPATIAAALVVGTLARENRKVGRRLLAIAKVAAKQAGAHEEE